MPADFRAQLQTLIANFEQASAEQDTHQDAQVAATTSFRKLLDDGVRTVRQLHPIVRNKQKNDPAKLAAWTSASHIESAPKRKQTPATPPAPTAKP